MQAMRETTCTFFVGRMWRATLVGRVAGRQCAPGQHKEHTTTHSDFFIFCQSTHEAHAHGWALQGANVE